MPKRVEEVRFKTERVRDAKVSEEGSAGVEGDESERDEELTVNGRCGCGLNS